MITLVNGLPEQFSLSMCDTITHKLYRFGYSVLEIVDTDSNHWWLPLPSSHFVMFTRNPE